MTYDLQRAPNDASTPEFQQQVRTLKARIWQTEQLKMITADVRRLHQQVADAIDDNEPWGPDNRAKMRGLIVLGPNGSSKSFSVEYALATLPPIELKSGAQIPPNILSWEASNGEARGWLRQFLALLGYDMARLPAPEQAMSQIETRLRMAKHTMIFCDELTRVLNPRNSGSKKKYAAQAEIVWSQIMQVMSDPVWPTPVIASGTMELRDTLQLHKPGTDELVARGDMLRRSELCCRPWTWNRMPRRSPTMWPPIARWPG